MQYASDSMAEHSVSSNPESKPVTDRKGNRVHPGDIVMIPCRVVGIDSHIHEFYNVMLKTIEPMYPSKSETPIILNVNQVELLEPLGHSDPSMDVQQAIEESRLVSDSAASMKAYGG